MSQRSFAWNTGSVVSGTVQYGELNVATGSVSQSYGGLFWIGGPQENNAYLIGHGTQSYEIGSDHPIRFWGTGSDTTQFVDLSNVLVNQSFTTGVQAYNWLISNGYWTNYITTSAAPTPVTSSVSPARTWFNEYSTYSNKIYSTHTVTTPSTVNGIWQWDNSTPSISSSIPDLADYWFRDSGASSDGKKILFSIGSTSIPVGDFETIALYDVVNNNVIATSSLDIPGTSSRDNNYFPQWTYNGISYDTSRNEFLINAYGYTTEGLPTSSVGWGDYRVLRYSTSSLSLNGYYYSLESGSDSRFLENFYNPNDDCLYGVGSYVSGSKNVVEIQKYDITANTYSNVYYDETNSSTPDPSGKTGRTWWFFSTTLVPETNEIWLNEQYYVPASSSYYFGIQVFDLNTNSISTIYNTKASSSFTDNQVYWVYDNNAKFMYTFLNYIQVWDVESKSLLTEISQSTNPNGGGTANLTKFTFLGANTTDTELWAGYRTLGYWDRFDLSSL